MNKPKVNTLRFVYKQFRWYALLHNVIKPFLLCYVNVTYKYGDHFHFYSRQMISDLNNAFDELEADQKIGAIVLTGGPKIFTGYFIYHYEVINFLK